MWKRLREQLERGVIAPAVVAVVAVGWIATGPVADPAGAAGARAPAPMPPASEAALALVGVDSGDTVAGWRVRRVSGPHSGRITVGLEREGQGFRVWVEPRGASAHRPPRKTQRYALFYGAPRPKGFALARTDWEPVVDALARNIERTEADVDPGW